MLLEQKIIIHTNRLDILTTTCEAILSLLMPFTWVFTYIPLLPLQHIEYLEVKAFILIGSHSVSDRHTLKVYGSL